MGTRDSGVCGDGLGGLPLDLHARREWIEEMAPGMLLSAPEDLMPERASEVPDPPWLNAWRVPLDPTRWGKTRLSGPDSEARDLGPLQREVEALLRPGA